MTAANAMSQGPVMICTLPRRTSAATFALLCAAGQALLRDEFGDAFLTARVVWGADNRTIAVQHGPICPNVKRAHRAFKQRRRRARPNKCAPVRLFK